MCRWLAYAGPPIYLESLIFKPKRSLLTQSRAAQMSVSAINADGFGIGWYGAKPQPGVYRDILPAWNDANLKSLAAQIASPLFFGHVRAATGTAVTRLNCHPFAYGRHLFMHNGMIGGFDKLRRVLAMAIRPDLYPLVQGTTDSELFFYLLLGNGLETDAEAAMRASVGQVLAAMSDAGIEGHFAMTAALSDGESVYAVRYANDERSPSLFYSVGAQPLDEIAESWQEVPPGHMLVAGSGGVAVSPFAPAA